MFDEKEYAKRYREANKEKAAQYNKEYRKKHKDRLLAYNNAWVKANSEKVKANGKKRYANKKEEIKQYISTYKKQNAAKTNALGKKRKLGKKQRTPKWLTSIDFERIETQYKLAYYLTKLTGQAYHVDHVIPLHGKTVSGLHTPTNLQVIPATLNLKKGISF